MPADRGHPARRTVRAAATLIAAGALAGLLATLLLRVAHQLAPAWYLVLVGAFAGAATALVSPYVSRPVLYPVPRHGAFEPPLPALAPLLELERRVTNGTRQRAAFRVGLQPVLRDLVDDRLMRSIGADFDTAARADPDRVRRLVGEELWEWLRAVGDQGRGPTMEELDTMVTRIGSM